MIVVLAQEVNVTLSEISDFIDTINTEGAGRRWATKLVDHLYDYALPNVSYALCNHQNLASLGLSCITYNDWVIAFKITDDALVVEKVVRDAILA